MFDCETCLVDPCECHTPERRRARGEVTIALSQVERDAIFAWIREDESVETMRLVVPVMKRLVGGG